MVEHTATSRQDKILFWACFISLVATGFGFTIRGFIIGDWETTFGFSQTEKGELLGAGLWPFALSIVGFSLFIDKIGYGKAMFFAFLCHTSSAVITILADSYQMLYIGTLIFALGSGTVEAAINPAVATMFSREKTKWLNILHAGWPTGIVVAGLLTMLVAQMDLDWRYKFALTFIPTIIYGIMMIGRHFPVSERVTAGVSYLAMLREVGIIGALIIFTLLVWQLAFSLNPFAERVLGVTIATPQFIIIATLIITGIYGIFVRSLGRPLFIFLLLLMMPLATTELGVDSWITDLMTPAMALLNLHAGWILIYTALVMATLRFFAGAIVHRISPIGLLCVSTIVAAVGLFFLSKAAGVAILGAATIYAMGKTFFWPTMLGVVSERFPRGGAMTLNFIAAVGVLVVGLAGAPALGHIQDTTIDRTIAAHDQANNTSYYTTYMGEVKENALGSYRPLNVAAVEAAPEADKAAITTIQNASKQSTLAKVAILPLVACLCFIGLMLYFKSQGGYRALHVSEGDHNA